MTDDLIKRLESAAEGSQEISDKCLLAVGWAWRYPAIGDGPHDYTGSDMVRPDGKFQNYSGLPSPSENVQDAIDWMVPEGCPWEMKSVGMVEMGTKCGPVEGIAATPAIALSAASLKARQRNG